MGKVKTKDEESTAELRDTLTFKGQARGRLGSSEARGVARDGKKHFKKEGECHCAKVLKG